MTPADSVALQAELAELIAIRSVSADPQRGEEMRRAAAWIAAQIEQAGGTAEPDERGAHPIVVGELPASHGAHSAPTVLCYGHYDVQPPGELDAWDTDPFELAAVGGWLQARGIADDKGPLYMLLKAAERLRAAGELPVNLRFVCDGEEEIGGDGPVELLRRDQRVTDAAVVFDGGWPSAEQPAFTLGVRGMCYFRVAVTTADADLHSGMYGGAALNALHALIRALAGLFEEDGRPAEPLRQGTMPPGREETATWRTLDQGHAQLAAVGAHPADPQAAESFHRRVWAETSVDVHGIEGGSPVLVKTVLPHRADANVSVRLAPGQRIDQVAAGFTRLLERSAPSGSTVDVALLGSCPPVAFPAEASVIRLAAEAFTDTFGVPPLLIRSGVSIPILAALAERGIPALVTGFALPESNLHAPNERIRAEHLPLGVRAAQAVFRRLGGLNG